MLLALLLDISYAIMGAGIGAGLAAIGAGFWVARRAIADSELLVAFDVISTLAIVTGVGFVLSAIVSWVLLRRFGLLQFPKGES